MPATEPRYSSSRIVSKATDPLRGIDIELIKSGEEISTYLSVHSRLLTPYKEDPALIEVVIETEEETQSFLAHLFSGRQKCLLPEEGTLFLLSCLKGNEETSIILPGYRRIFPPHFLQGGDEIFDSSVSFSFEFKLD